MEDAAHYVAEDAELVEVAEFHTHFESCLDISLAHSRKQSDTPIIT